MTNNPTIDGVCSTCLGSGKEYDGAAHTCTSCNGLGGAPAVERQEPVARCRQSPVRKYLSVELLRTHMKDGDLLYSAPPEVAALQSTIAQLEDKLSKAIDLDFQRRETIEQLQARAQELGAELSPISELAILRAANRELEAFRDKSVRIKCGLEDYPDAPPAPVAVVHPFAEKVIRKLRRFDECASDSDADGVDIGRHWLDLLTQLGLLNRVQRSPALWEITQQGEDCLGATAELNRDNN